MLVYQSCVQQCNISVTHSEWMIMEVFKKNNYLGGHHLLEKLVVNYSNQNCWCGSFYTG